MSSNTRARIELREIDAVSRATRSMGREELSDEECGIEQRDKDKEEMHMPDKKPVKEKTDKKDSNGNEMTGGASGSSHRARASPSRAAAGRVRFEKVPAEARQYLK